MIFLLVISTAGYSLISSTHDDNQEVEENGFKFLRGSGGWITSVNEQNFGFRYLPSELENVSIQGDYSLNDYSNSDVIYFVGSSDAVQEILSNLARFVLRYQEACLNESKCGGDFPIKTCSDKLIILNPENITKVYKKDNCVHIQGDQLKAADAFLYKVLKIK